MNLSISVYAVLLSTVLANFCSAAAATNSQKSAPAAPQPANTAQKNPSTQLATKTSISHKEAISAAMRAHFGRIKDFQPTDLIRQSDAKDVLALLAEDDFVLAEPNSTKLRIPADGSFIQKSLASGKGRKFMRKLGKIPSGFKNYQLIAALPGGEQTARDLIQATGGEQMVRYLASTKQGTKLGSKLSKRKKGRQKQTQGPRIYSANDLAVALLKEFGSAPN